MLPTLTATEIDGFPGGEVILRSQTWDDYELLLQTRRRPSAIKISYNASSQAIRIMSPLPKYARGCGLRPARDICLARFRKSSTLG